ncbi:phasin family protein [Micromonospora sp. NPDC018662]|uniref:phasin family protein n=1 Tax=Micromonospora sp. NPDC018662 TaxID=3364238 RepID=UPI0037A2ECDC
MQDAWRAYLSLAMGLTEAPRKKAQDAVMRVVGQGGATAGQLQSLAEELVATGLANREALTKLVRFEVDRALGAVGLATADEVAELTRRVHDLERQLREARTSVEPATPAAPTTPAPATSTPTTSAPASSGTVPGRTEEDGTVPSKAVAKKAVAKKAIARKPAATVARTPAGESPAAPARPARKATGRRADGS